MHTEEQGYQELRSRIRTVLRDIRRQANLSQQDFGELVGGLSRYTVMRLEAGTTELHLQQAQSIETATGDRRLVALLEARDRLADLRRGAPTRERGVQDLIERSSMYRIVVCLLDDLKLHDLLNGQAALADVDLVVVVPTRARERQLFDGQPILGHIENEISRLGDLSPMPASVSVFESTRVIQPAIVVRRSTGDECATWPLLPVADRVRSETPPIATSTDPTVVADLQAHLDWVLDPGAARRVHINDTVGELEVRPSRKPGNLRFVGYVHHGDEELDQRNPDIGNLVSFLVLYGMMTRDGYPPRRRVMLYERRNVKYDVGRWSLVSSHVEAGDVRRALGADDPDTAWRGFLEPDEAALRDSALLEGSNFVLPDDVFKQAAAREFEARFGPRFKRADIVERLVPLDVPAEAARIEKRPREGTEQLRRPIYPRVFALELRGPGHNDADGSINEAKLMHQSNIRTEAFGLRDLADADPTRFNDFIVTAMHDGWLRHALQELGIANQ